MKADHRANASFPGERSQFFCFFEITCKWPFDEDILLGLERRNNCVVVTRDVDADSNDVNIGVVREICRVAVRSCRSEIIFRRSFLS